MPYQRTKDEVEAALADHDYLRAVGSFAMQHSLVSIYSTSTVVRTPDTVLRGRWAGAGDDLAGESLLLNYRTDNARHGFQLGIGRFYEPDAVLTSCHADLEEDLRETVPLPAPKKLRTGLTAAVTTRRSSRELTGEPVSLAELATLLHHAQGNTGELPYGNPADPHGMIKLRTAPSGGGLYPVTLFVQALNVTGLPAGAYEYFPYSHSLKPVRPPGADPVDPLALYRSPDLAIDQAAVVFTFVYNLHHNSRKYGDGGVVFGLIEVGAILQNLHLTRTALALAGCDQGGYDKQRIEQALGLDGHTRHVVHVSIIGQEG
ncbi:SagB family peptide dehydrogenase [Natronosporangium hydrolyticum]|uniref:SagB family peptide dehydrogenase n=1 Tax=Natronosporangium hydrolyticum TaxID=2811111 RepID=A0A895Y4S8_9ACTN|nr:SagB family peptide dehydrogenase [Natronosporangium hydrolyticum]QSB12704.1 SagB family peptide dehydrogenase [Natronosporangium hydrolyticum]